MGTNENIIVNSHKRSMLYGIKKESNKSNKCLNSASILNVLKVNDTLINVATKYMNMFEEVLMDENFIIVLTDKEGCILHITGASEAVKKYEALNITKGMYMDEKNIGTNAMAVAISENRPVQITAEEHYINIFKTLTCSAAPIHGKNGEVIGTLNLTSQWKNKHPHTLGLVMYCVKAIENELEKYHAKNILRETYNYMGGIIDNVERGIILVNEFGYIKNANELACKIVNLEKDMLLNRKIENLIPSWNNIFLSFQEGKSTAYYKDIKLNHDINEKTNINIKPIFLSDRIIGAIIKLRKDKDIVSKNHGIGAYKYFHDIIGNSDAITNVITNCKVVSNSPSTILITGESGTGKEVLAQSIHNYSYRRDNRFVAINCGAIPKNLIESELFGYVDGAFTGAKKGGKIGKFELASGGTIFLDEIGEMPLDMQVHLLRVIQEGRVTPIGSEKEIPVDVRIIAATNKNLREEILKGNFREDLYYRLSVIPIKVPSLKERKGDIEILIDHFLRVKSLKLNKPIPKISDNLYKSLLEYNWPGNIRELENYIENIVNLDGIITSDLPINNDIKEETIIKDRNVNNTQILSLDASKGFKIKDLELQLINKVIEINDFNMSKAAKELGISRNTLYNKLNKMS